METQAQNARANRWGWLTFVLAFGLCLLALSWLLRSQAQAQQARAATVAHEKALLIRNLLEHAGHAAIALGTAIAPAGQHQALAVGSQREFETLAQPLLREFQGVTALQYAPAGVIRWTMPLSGNETATGHDLLSPHTRHPLTLEAMHTGRMLLLGPQVLKQGGWGVISRNPIYRVPGQTDTFLGFTQALLCLPEGLAPARLGDLAAQGLEYQLWRPRPDDSQPELILPRPGSGPGADAVWPAEQATTADLGLSHVRWFISVRPQQGLSPYQQGLYWALLGLLLSMTLALYVRKVQLLRYAAQERDDIRRRVRRLELERQLHEVQRAQERIDDLLPLGVYRFHFDAQGQVVADHLSPVLCALFELEREAMLADLAPAFAKIFPEDLQTMRATLHRAWQQPGPLHWRGRIRLQDESLRWLETRAVPHPSSQTTTGYVGYIMDISEQVGAQEQISSTLQQAQTARTEAERANSAKSLFLATMSHEMRTPLNAIIGLGDLLSFSPLDAEQHNHLTELQRASRMLLGIINDVLDLAKIEAGEFELAQERLHLSPLLDEVRRLSQVSADMKGLALDVAPLPPELAQRAYLGDPLRLRQILLNLVSNAIKFTAQGRIGLSVSASPAASAERMRLHFEVSDTGIGIPADLLPQLFHPFVQADSGNTRRFGGTGLGLSVVRELAERMDGGVQVRSQPGQGSTFCVHIELALLPDTASSPDGEAAPTEVDGRLRLEGVRLLLVDDSDMNLEVAGQLLRREGAVVDTCSNGQQALEWLGDYGAQVDVVLMDVQMPVMDGNTAVGHIRSHPQLAQLPVIALTAGAMYSEREKSLQAGMSDYLTKPFERGQMVRLIRQHVQRYRGQPLPEGRLRPAAQPAADWPHVDGIAQTQVRQRLNGDRALFIKLLQRLLDEFGELAHPHPIAQDEVACKPLKQHLHKLAGNAGLLGANSVYLLAKETETALRAQNWALATTSMRQLAAQMAQLAQAAAPVLAQATVTEPPPPLADQPPLEAAELALLRDELARQQLSALAHYQRLAGRLKNVLTASEFLALDQAMNTLNFRAALTQIQSL